MSIGKIKTIREVTGLSVGEISKALAESGGDETKAMNILKARGAQIAQKKSSREIKEGVVEAYIHNNKKVGAIVELGSETDFVARNEEFRKLAYELAMQITSMNPGSTNELMAQMFIKDNSISVADLIDRYIAKFGENIKIRNFARFEI